MIPYFSDERWTIVGGVINIGYRFPHQFLGKGDVRAIKFRGITLEKPMR